MSSPVIPVDNLSPSFFYRYDALKNDADSLEHSEAAMTEAQYALQKVQKDLDNVAKEVEHNRSVYKEQVDRIRLVSTHWFYGTTTLQPQLWFRGGCEGKIARAKLKLAAAEQEYPSLWHVQEQLQTQHIPPLKAAVVERMSIYERCVAAISKRESMKEEAVSQYPSPELCQLQVKSDNLQQQWNAIQQHTDIVARAKTCQVAAVSDYYSAACSLRDADRLHQRYVRQERDLKEMKAQLARHMKTNRPCANKECGFAVSSWHPTHCCNACQHGKPFPQDHGKHCERKTLDSSRQFEQRTTEERLQREIEYDNTKCKAKLTEAEDFSTRASGQLQQASTILQLMTSDNNASLLVLGSFIPATTSSSLVSFGCACNTNREVSIQRALRFVHQQQSENEPLAKHIRVLESKLQEGRDAIQRQQEQTTHAIAVEKSQIFDDLRFQVMSTSATSTFIEPSAPPGP
jgi:hypothetical protein